MDGIDLHQGVHRGAVCIGDLGKGVPGRYLVDGSAAGVRLCRGPAAGGRPALGVIHIGQFSVFGPGPRVVPRFAPDVPHGRDLHLVFPLGGTLHRQAVPDVNSDMAGHPHRFTHGHVGPSGCGNVQAPGDHGVRPYVRDPVAGIIGSSVGLGGVPAPPPQNALDQAHAVKAIYGRVLVSRRLDHGRAVRRSVVGMVIAVAAHVGTCQRCPETAHNVQGFEVLGDLHRLFHEYIGFHFTHCFAPPVLLSSCAPGPPVPSAGPALFPLWS